MSSGDKVLIYGYKNGDTIHNIFKKEQFGSHYSYSKIYQG